MAEMLTIDPELEGLLREVAADPESSLLRVPRGKQIETLFDRQITYTTVAYRPLSKLERHLIQVHRNELAELLRQACLHRLVEGSRSRLFVSRFASLHRKLRIRGLADFRSALGTFHEIHNGSVPDHLPALRLLEECARPLDRDRPTVVALACAAFALQRSDDFRLFASSELIQGTAPTTALLLLREVLQSMPSRSNTLSAWTQVGLAYSRLLRHEEAREAYSHACILDEHNVVAWMSRFLLAFQCGHLEDIRHVASRLEDSTLIGHPAMEHFIESSRILRRSGEWVPTRTATDLRNTLHLEPGTIPGRLADVLS